jgi:hypothetical protein
MALRVSRIALAIALVGAGLGASASSASAAFHLMKISEVHFSNAGDLDYVELQMHSGGQNFVGGHFLRLYHPDGAPQATFTLPSSVPNGDNQRTVLIGNSDVDADFNSNVIEPNLAGGAACFLDHLGIGGDAGNPDAGIDCVAWGSFDGSFTEGTPSPVGQPVAPGGMSSGQSLTRLIGAGCPTLLESSDDTNSSVADFAVTAPTPRRNSVVPTEKACTTAKPPPPTKKKKCKKKGKKGDASAAKKKCKKKKK